MQDLQVNSWSEFNTQSAPAVRQGHGFIRLDFVIRVALALSDFVTVQRDRQAQQVCNLRQAENHRRCFVVSINFHIIFFFPHCFAALCERRYKSQPLIRWDVRSSTMNTRLVQRPGTVTSTFVPSGIHRGAAIVRPSTGTVPAAVRPISSGQQSAQAQYAVRMLVMARESTCDILRG